MTERINKARYWVAVLWLENMVSGWVEKIDDLIQLPYVYCVHDKDTDTRSEHRKPHVHLILAFPNTTTYKHALEVFKLLGEKSVNTCEACVSVRHMYDYLIHDTESCRKQGKHLYSPDERIVGNGFEIGLYEQISISEKQELLKQLVDYIIDRNFTNITDFTVAAMREFDSRYWDIIVGYNGILERYCKGNYLKWKRTLEVRQHNWENPPRASDNDYSLDEIAGAKPGEDGTVRL